MKLIRNGLVPEQMEDKWFIYWKDDALYFHRSWTGFCVYVVRFRCSGNRCGMVEAAVNRDPEQYSETSDQADAEMISYLIDALLLRREAAFPGTELSSEDQALAQWGQVGRAMLGQFPPDNGSGLHVCIHRGAHQIGGTCVELA